MDVDPQTVQKATPGVLGALGSVFFLSGPWWVRLGMVVPGAALSYYAAASVAQFSGMAEGLSGFIVGMLGMVFVAKIIATWQAMDIGAIIVQWLRRLLGLQGGGQ